MGNRFPSPFKPLKSQRGVALLIALFAFTLLTFLAVEVSRDTAVDYMVSNQQVNRIQAYYAAKAGVELSLMRIMLYKQAMASFGSQLGDQKNMLDPIWSFPFMWPPQVGDAEGVTEVDKGQIETAVKESIMAGQYATTISPEGGRLDINDLGSDIKILRTAMQQQLLKIFQQELENNEDFADKYRGHRFEDLVAAITDYIDEDSEGTNGGDESSGYRDIEADDLKLPPNRPLRTVDELHMVAGMKDDFYNLIAPRITVFGTKGINVNYAEKDVLKALDITMTEEAINKVVERRSDPKLGGPFKNDDEFFGFLQTYGVNTRAIAESKVPLLYGIEFNFRVTSTGVASNVRREITAITYDYANLTTRYTELLNKQDDANKTPEQKQQDEQNKDQNKDAGKGKQDQGQATAIKTSKGRPTVVYWEEN